MLIKQKHNKMNTYYNLYGCMDDYFILSSAQSFCLFVPLILKEQA